MKTINGDGTRPAEYVAWRSMRRRCRDPKYVGYHRYGARGITVCERWLSSFDNFIQDMGPKPSASHSLDRIDNDGNYEPDNCRWATPAEQQSNTCLNRRITLGDETMTISQWARKYGLRPRLISLRLFRGWDEARAIKTPTNIKTKQRSVEA